mmetsp:Transcript_7911/g.12937  ORF Transcript_7911/g.12937 Transcript_7911/m.12937 type:complete len:224 (+) Transcript_7911:519-1190(+)
MHLNSPRASIGFIRFAASTLLLSERPAPSTKCNSSMNRSTDPSAARISVSTARRRSSKSPRRPVPARRAPMSSDHTSRTLCNCGGTSPFAIRCATASATAVLPTPGWPIKHTLFLVRRARICKTRATSSSRPMTGSSRPWIACWTRSTPKDASTSRLALVLLLLLPPPACLTNLLAAMPAFFGALDGSDEELLDPLAIRWGGGNFGGKRDGRKGLVFSASCFS